MKMEEMQEQRNIFYESIREEETRKLLSALANGRNMTLAAPRRIGKTGLIHNVFNKVRNSEDNIICIYVDIFPTEGKTATPNKGAFIQKYSLKAASTVSSALSALIDKELVYRSPDGYSVYDRFLEIWLREL